MSDLKLERFEIDINLKRARVRGEVQFYSKTTPMAYALSSYMP